MGQIIKMRSGFGAFIVKRLPLAAGAYAVLGASISLMGWVLGIPRLADWANTTITMKVNTAICALLVGTGLLISVLAPRQKLIVRVLSSFVILVGIATLYQHVTGINLGIDTLLFDEPPGSPATASPGRMGPPASISFIMISIALILGTASAQMRQVSGWFAVIVVGLATLPLVGYFYGASQLYSVSIYTGVAMQTATMIAAVAGGIVISRPEFALSPLFVRPDGGAVMFRRLVFPVILIALVLGWFRVLGQELGYYDTAFGTALRTIIEIGLLLGLLYWAADGVSRADETLRQADRRKDEFIATLSHELRNPLAPIRNAVEILKHEDTGDRKVGEARDMIERQLTHMVRLIDDLLDVSRITRDKLEIRKAKVELGTILNQAVETLSPVLKSHGHKLSVQLPAEKIYLEADAVRLSQVFSNLLNNAGKFTVPGGELLLSAEKIAGHKVVVRVVDNGIGIPEDKLSTIFDMFTQAERAVDEAQTGLGIGLTLAKQIVELHDGTIAAHSGGNGQGSEFIITLPFVATLSTGEAEKARVQPAVTVLEKPVAKQRILVVDDNVDSAESMSLLMEIAGNETTMAHDGVDAIAMAKAYKPDAVLLDIGLPSADGYEVCRAIRGETWGRSTVIIALTGWGQDDDRRRTAEAGFDAHMVKPVDPDELLSLLTRLRK